MKLRNTEIKESEIQQFNKFILTLKNPIYKIEFNPSGQIILLDTTDKKIIAWAKDNGLK